MDWLLILGVLAFGGLIIGWMGYSRITDNLLKEQEREIAKLRRENRRLTTATAKVKKIRGNITPDFKEW